MAGEFDEIRGRLEAIAEELADLAIVRLRESIDAGGHEIARGLVAYDGADAVRIAGRRTQDIAGILGYDARSAMVHRDDLVLGTGPKLARKGEPA